MNARCHRPHHPSFQYYGGRGIAVCKEWRRDFTAFFDYVGERPSPKHSIERIDNSRGYEPGNVRWATRAEQMRNTRGNHWIEIDGVRKLITEWAEEKGIDQTTLSHRIARGMSERDAVMTPPREGGRRMSKKTAK